MLEALRWIHLVAAAVWLGGLIVLAASVMALRRAGAPREHLQAVARQFGRVSWTAMLLAVLTGLGQVQLLGLSWGYAPLQVKVGLVATVIVVAFTHTLTAKRSPPAVRGIVESTILLLSLAIYWAAVRL
jgi:putative copper export protein